LIAFGQNKNGSQFSFGNNSGSNSPFNSQPVSSAGFFSNNINSNISTNTFGSPGHSLTNGNQSLFGQCPNNNNISNGIFGQNKSDGLFGKPATTGAGLFGGISNMGDNNQNNLFGNNQNIPSNTLWSQNNNNNNNMLAINRTSPSLFRNSLDDNNNNTGGSLFGNTTTQSSQGLFGSTTNKVTTSLFGNSNSALGGTSLFGNTLGSSANNLTNTTTTGTLFSQTKPPGTSIFGSASVSNTSLFGNNNQATSNGGPSTLFGSPQPTGSTLFGTNTLNIAGNTSIANIGSNLSTLNNNSPPNMSCCCPKGNDDDIPENVPNLYEKWFKDKNKPKQKTVECGVKEEWEQDLSYVLKQSMEKLAQNRRPVLINESEICTVLTVPEKPPATRPATIAIELPLPRPVYSEQVLVHPYMLPAKFDHNTSIIKPSRPPRSPIKFTSNSYHLTE